MTIINFYKRAAFGMVGAMAVGALTIPGALMAAPQSVSEIANYQGKDREAILLAGAKKEGKFQLYTTGTQTQPIIQAFEKKYPFLKVQVYRAGNSGIVKRLSEEYKAGHHSVDAINITTGGLRILGKAGILQPFSTPMTKFFPKKAIEAHRWWVVEYEGSLSLAWNTKIYDRKDVPKNYDDLLDPKWKGKMAVSGRSTTFASWIGVAIMEKGEDYVRKLGKQDIALYQLSGKALSNLVVSGEVGLSPAVYQSHMINSQRKGASVAWLPLGGVYANIGGAAVATKAPHPHAAMLFTDFVLSKESQTIRQAIGYSTARSDMPSQGLRPSKLYYITERPTYREDTEKWLGMVREIFGKAKKAPKKKKK